MKDSQLPLVLIVDDNPQNVQVLGNVVEDAGYRAAIAMTGRDALRFLANNNKVDLILPDVMMPEMDGFDVCRHLKDAPDLKDIPVIFLTAKVETEDLVEAFECGALDYITKPFNPVELKVRMRTHIKLKRAIEEIKTLRGMIPICTYCKKIRDDEGFWEQVDVYIQHNTEAVFTHGICPDCADKAMEQLKAWEQEHGCQHKNGCEHDTPD